jgi:hypothetical protein
LLAGLTWLQQRRCGKTELRDGHRLRVAFISLPLNQRRDLVGDRFDLQFLFLLSQRLSLHVRFRHRCHLFGYPIRLLLIPVVRLGDGELGLKSALHIPVAPPLL